MSAARAECVSSPRGYEVDARLGNRPHRGKGHVSGGFDKSFPPDALHGLLHCIDGHVVEHDDVRTRREGFLDLGQVLHLHLDFHHQRGLSPHPAHGLGDAPGRLDVVVLDQDPVIEPVPMIAPAAGPHAVLVEDPQAGNRLARVEDLCLRAGHGVDELLRQGGDPAHPLKEIQGDPLGREDARQRSR